MLFLAYSRCLLEVSNATGTYNIYEQIFEEVEDEITSTSTTYSTEMYGVTMIGEYSASIEFKIIGDVFLMAIELHEGLEYSGLTSSSPVYLISHIFI